jgi:hypothetical protein
MKGVARTEAQQVRVREIQRRTNEERRALVAAAPARGVADPVVRAKSFALTDRMLAEERALLTPAQRVRFEKNVAEIHASRANLPKH